MKRDNEAGAEPFLPAKRDLRSLAKAAARCEGCDLHARATQTVFGEGPPDARLVLIGETPGDQEDLAGRPFVGPAGRLLDEMMIAAGLRREEIYVTNAVKHFKWEPRGKRRLHQKPTWNEIRICHTWLRAELAAIEPEIVVALGATAAQALVGKAFRVTQQRGQWIATDIAPRFLATYHPSVILRMEHDARASARDELESDLRKVARALEGAPSRRRKKAV